MDKSNMKLPLEILYMILKELSFNEVHHIVKTLNLADDFWLYYLYQKYDPYGELKLQFPLFYDRWGIHYLFETPHELLVHLENGVHNEQRHLSIFLNSTYLYQKYLIKWHDIGGDLVYATKQNSMKIIEIICKHPFLTIYDLNTALVYAIRNSNLPIIERLLRSGIRCIDLSLEEATRIGNTEIIEYLESFNASFKLCPGGYFQLDLLEQ